MPAESNHACQEGVLLLCVSQELQHWVSQTKKDLCDFFETFARSSDAEKEAMQIRMDEHLKKKTVSRQLKEETKLLFGSSERTALRQRTAVVQALQWPWPVRKRFSSDH